MKKAITIAVLTLFVTVNTGFLQAQTYSPDKTVTVNVDDNDTYNPKIYIINEGSAALDLSWEVVSNTFLTGWDVALCDWMQCYTTLPSGVVEPADIDPSDTVFMYPMVAVNSLPGSGSLKIRIFPTGTSTAGDTLTFTINASNSVGINEADGWYSNIKLYPNPATGFINIETKNDIENVLIYNALGEQVTQQLTLNQKGLNKLDVSFLPEGIYFIRFNNDNADYTHKFYKTY